MYHAYTVNRFCNISFGLLSSIEKNSFTHLKCEDFIATFGVQFIDLRINNYIKQKKEVYENWF